MKASSKPRRIQLPHAQESYEDWVKNRKEMIGLLGVAVPTNEKFWKTGYEKYLQCFQKPQPE